MWSQLFSSASPLNWWLVGMNLYYEFHFLALKSQLADVSDHYVCHAHHSHRCFSLSYSLWHVYVYVYVYVMLLYYWMLNKYSGTYYSVFSVQCTAHKYLRRVMRWHDDAYYLDTSTRSSK
jgi:hypothetical protein